MPEHLTMEFFHHWMPLLELKNEIPESRMESLSAAVRSNTALRIYANLLAGWLLERTPCPDARELPYPVALLGERGLVCFRSCRRWLRCRGLPKLMPGSDLTDHM